MDTVEELVTLPFREVIEKGNLAIENAADHPVMMREAQRLVKMGERSLARIEASSQKLYNEYGINFLIALKENDEITEYRKLLTDLLWDFEDFIEADTFEIEKFQELQALNRDVAPKIYNVLITLKLEAQSGFLSQLSPPSSPHPQQLPRGHTGQHVSIASLPSTRGSTSSQADATSILDFSNVEDATDQLRTLTSMRSLSSVHSHDHDNGATLYEQEDKAAPAVGSKSLPSPPKLPTLDPWDPRTLCNDDSKANGHGPVGRRPDVIRPESPVDPAISPCNHDHRMRLPAGSLFPYSPTVLSHEFESDESSEYRHSGSSALSLSTSATSHGTRPRALHPLSPTIPEEETPPKSSKNNYVPPLQARPPAFHGVHQHIQDSSADCSHVGDMSRQYEALRRPQGQPPNSPLPRLPTFRKDDNLRAGDSSPEPGQSSLKSPLHAEAFAQMAAEQGLIPVESEREVEVDHLSSQKDCTIGPDSSFYQYKGFCEGAREVTRGGIGVRKSKRPGFASATTVAKCTGCFFELDFAHIEADVNKEDKGNFHKCGIDYRLRFLQKSHISLKRSDDVLFACVFCVQAGKTMDECDATVFAGSQALFNHLAHHPRPLPKIPGIAVVEDESMPARLMNDYDLHFRAPAIAHPAQMNVTQIHGKPTGFARDQCRRLHGQRLLYDRSPALELCHGGRVTGIEWPEKYNGEWLFAWHDGKFASVHNSIIRLNPPPAEDVRAIGTSLLRAKSRWRFQQKEKDKDNNLWLKFDKNEAITNISYPYSDFWCWAGTNAKGKWGIFPKVFLEPSSVQELSVEGADRSLTLSNEMNKSSSMFKLRFGRPASIAESSGGHSVGPSMCSVGGDS